MKHLLFQHKHLSLQKIKERMIQFCIMFVGLFFSVVAFADDPSLGTSNFGSVALKLQGEATSVKSFLWSGSQVAGIIIAIVGINMWAKAAKHEDGRHSHGRAVLITVIGSLMFFLPTIMGVGASSILGN